jgi:hypothetical protein
VSSSSERSQHLFLVHIWQEPGEEAASGWRGSVEHVPSRQRMYFKSLRDLNDFILLRLGSLAAPADTPDKQA